VKYTGLYKFLTSPIVLQNLAEKYLHVTRRGPVFVGSTVLTLLLSSRMESGVSGTCSD